MKKIRTALPRRKNMKDLPAATMAKSSRSTGKGGYFSSMSRLPLPPEVMELIFWHMDEATFSISLRACKQFMAAGATRRNLLKQIRRIPGWRPGLEDLHQQNLLNEFQRRAGASACTASVLADLREGKLPPGTIASISAFSPAPETIDGHSDLALANISGMVSIYTLGPGDVHLNLTIDLQKYCSTRDPVEISGLAWSQMGDLLVLCSQNDTICHRRSGYNDHVREDDDSDDILTRRIFDSFTFIRIHSTQREQESRFATQHPRRIRILPLAGAEPKGVALAADGKRSIAWLDRCATREMQLHVELIRDSESEDNNLASTNTQLSDLHYYDEEASAHIFIPFPNDAIYRGKVHMQFIAGDEMLLLRQGPNPLPTFFKGVLASDDGDPSFPLPTQGIMSHPIQSYREDHCVGMPFYGRHSSHVTDSWVLQDPVCQKSYLALGTHRDNQSSTNMDCLYVLLCNRNIDPNSCDHAIELDEVLSRLRWYRAALLAGWRRGTSTLGSLVEIAPGGRRIASADWDRVLVWTIDPLALHQRVLEHYFPPRDYNRTKDFGRIRPVLLPKQGVVRSMRWIDNDTLFALTGNGLVRWYIGHAATGKRELVSEPSNSAPRSPELSSTAPASKAEKTANRPTRSSARLKSLQHLRDRNVR